MGETERTSLEVKVAELGEQVKALNGKVDMLLGILKGDMAAQKEVVAACKEACTTTVNDLYNKYNDLKSDVDKLIGARINPAWIYASAMVLGTICGLVGLVIGLKSGVH